MKILPLLILFATPAVLAEVQDPCLTTEHWNLNRKGSSPLGFGISMNSPPVVRRM